ncbi:MAG: hypothetical protein HYY18_01260 [Planctomycetes bacterium]|nr:hypothetical protein [Planctomycetota bacterium]
MVEQQHLVNIAKAIEKGTRVTTLDELRAKGQNQVKVINAAKIMELIKEAVDIAIESMTGQKVGAEREKLQAAAKKEFDELLKKYQDQQRTKGEIEGQASKMQAEIDAVQNMLKGGLGGSAEAQMGLAGLSGQIAQLVQKLQTSEKSRIEAAVHQKRIEADLEDMKKKYAALEAEKASVLNTQRSVAGAVDQAYARVDAGLGQKARELGLDLGPEPRTPEEKMERLAKIADAAMASLESEKSQKVEAKRQLEQALKEKAAMAAEAQRTKEQLAATEAKKSGLEREYAVVQDFKKSLEGKTSDQQQQLAQVQQQLAQTRQELAQSQAKKSVAEKELGELQDFKKKLEEKVDEQGTQYAEVHQMMAAIGKRADDLIREVESGRLKHLKPEEKKIIIDAMNDMKDTLKKLQDERAFLEKKLFYMSMTIDSLESELLAAKGLTPGVGGSAHLKDDGLVITFDEAGLAF